MIDFSDLAEPIYKTTINSTDAMNGDIISAIHKNFPLAVKQVQNLAPKFKGANRTETARNIWNMLKTFKIYKRDANNFQLIRLPARFLRIRKGGDCKSYSLTAAALMAANGIPVKFRYAGYTTNGKQPTHVYTIGTDEKGNEIIVDGCYTEFNKQKAPSFFKDYKMTVATLAGIFEGTTLKEKVKALKQTNPGIYQRVITIWNGVKYLDQSNPTRKAGVKAIRAMVEGVNVSGIGDRAARQARRAERKASGKASTGKKVALSPGRAAFLELVKLNGRGIARKLSKISKESLAAKWKKLGGNPDKLFKAIETGKAKKPLLGESKKNKSLGYVTPIGVITIAAILVAAAPVLLAVSQLLPKGQDESGLSTSDILNEAKEEGGQMFDASSDEYDITDKGTGADHSGFSLSVPVMLGAAAVAIFLIMKKK